MSATPIKLPTQATAKALPSATVKPLAAGDCVGGAPSESPSSDDAEALQLRIRVIALENLVIALLAHATVSQLELAREMAAYISPRPGYTPHQLTLRAADEMRSLVDRSMQFRARPAT